MSGTRAVKPRTTTNAPMRPAAARAQIDRPSATPAASRAATERLLGWNAPLMYSDNGAVAAASNSVASQSRAPRGTRELVLGAGPAKTVTASASATSTIAMTIIHRVSG